MAKGSIGVTTNNIFPVIKKFLYSDHEIFLRELISNAVDATQKLKTLAAAGDFKGETEGLKVSVSIDKDHHWPLWTGLLLSLHGSQEGGDTHPVVGRGRQASSLVVRRFARV